jgi:lipopolysaccharide export system protein LptA
MKKISLTLFLVSIIMTAFSQDTLNSKVHTEKLPWKFNAQQARESKDRQVIELTGSVRVSSGTQISIEADKAIIDKKQGALTTFGTTKIEFDGVITLKKTYTGTCKYVFGEETLSLE